MEVLENGTIQVRESTRISEDGVVISNKYHRYVVTPGQDVSDKDQKVQDLAASIWTDAVIDAYAAEQGQELTLDQRKTIKARQLYANIKKFIETLPSGFPRYDADLKMGLMNAIMTYMAAGQSPPANILAAKNWLQTVQGLFVTKKAEIEAITVETPETIEPVIEEGMTDEQIAEAQAVADAANASALEAAQQAAQDAVEAIDVSIATLEAEYGRSGTVLADPAVSTADLIAQ